MEGNKGNKLRDSPLKGLITPVPLTGHGPLSLYEILTCGVYSEQHAEAAAPLKGASASFIKSIGVLPLLHPEQDA